MSNRTIYSRSRQTSMVGMSLVFVLVLMMVAQSVGAQQLGGTLIQGVDSEPRILLPAATSGVSDNIVACRIYEGLIRVDRDWRPAPLLAKSWDVSEDGRTYTFYLREDVRWHDGMPFTSADVKFTLEEIAFQYHPRTSLLGSVTESIETPDDHTVILRLGEAYGPALSLLSCESAGIAPKHVFDNTDILSNWA